MKEVMPFALKLLGDSGCDIYTYGGSYAAHIMDDLKERFPEGTEFPLIEIANAILSISRPAPIVRAPYLMVWENEDCCDGIDCDSLEAAKVAALETLADWATDERRKWKADTPDENEAEHWDCMIYNCRVSVSKYNSATDEYEEDFWSPSYEDETEIGWVLTEELRKEGEQE